ncbi:MAG: DUF1275 domain-containing protein [Proteobacteria bacterium]|nr:DUF1275 domain-containing protein [Pseudomonadota bacterium]
MPETEPDPAAPTADHGRLFPLSLAGIAGFSDAFGYLRLHGLLTAHITGNLAFMAVGLAQGSPRIIMKFLALPLFMVGVGLATIIMTRVSDRRFSPLGFALLLEAALLGCCLLVGMWLPPCQSTDDLTGVSVGTILIMGMATQNAIMRQPLHNLPATTAMTTNVTEATVQWTHWLTGFGRKLSPGDKRELFSRARTIGMTVGAFAVGAVAGGLSAADVGYISLLGPIVLLLLLAARAIDLHRQGRGVAIRAYEPHRPDIIQGVPAKPAKPRE